MRPPLPDLVTNWWSGWNFLVKILRSYASQQLFERIPRTLRWRYNQILFGKPELDRSALLERHLLGHVLWNSDSQAIAPLLYRRFHSRFSQCIYKNDTTG